LEEDFMSLMICPDCGHEVSTAALACANCGRPITDPTIERNVVITDVPAESDGFPKWVFIPVAAVGLLILFFLFLLMRNNDDTANANIRVNTARPQQDVRDTTTLRTEAPSDTTTGTTTVTVPQTQSSTVTSAPSENTNPSKGKVSLEAKFKTPRTGLQVVKNVKFYLLKKDLDEILDDADIEDTSGQGLRNAFGMSFLFRDRDPETYPKAMQADIKPDSYYLFAITKAGRGFAIWSAPVVIGAGENPLLDLSQPIVTEVQ